MVGRLMWFGWRVFNGVRRLVFGVIALVLLGMVLGGMLGGGADDVPTRAALVLRPSGIIVEELEGDGLQRAVSRLTGTQTLETLLSDLLEAIELAAEDDRIQALVLDTNGMFGAGLSKLESLAAAIDDFQATGKPVIATADAYTRGSYHLAAQADEVFLHNMGVVLLEGYSVYRTYYKEGIDRYGIDWNVFRVGEYKSAVEPYLRTSMSEEAKRSNLAWLGDLWTSYVDGIASARDLDPDAITGYVTDYVERLRVAEGDAAVVALEAGLVDHLASRDQVRARLIELVGEDKHHAFNQIDHETYLLSHGRRDLDGGGDAVAVVVAKGTILPGRQPPGAIGGTSTAALIRDAREDDDVKAVVLRVDSGGGSAFASEVIRRQLELTREAGKPVVVSMGSVAASGGYWIAAASDEIWASPNTLTGSIGIFGMFPTFEEPLARYFGIRVDGVGTTPLAGLTRPDRALPPEIEEGIQLGIEDGYRRFLRLVADAREMDVEAVDAIARGRVWSGTDALELGLVDQLGGLEDAIASAATKADLGEDFAVRTMTQKRGVGEQLMIDLLTRARAWIGPGPVRPPEAPHVLLTRFLADRYDDMARFKDPHGRIAHCLCDVQ